MTTKQGVYILHAENGLTKIGCTGNFDQRMRDYKRMPVEMRLIRLIETPDYMEMEAFLHRAFESKRKKNEWFSLTASDLHVLRSVEADFLKTLSDADKESPAIWASMQAMMSTLQLLFAEIDNIAEDNRLSPGYRDALDGAKKRFGNQFIDDLISFASSVYRDRSSH